MFSMEGDLLDSWSGNFIDAHGKETDNLGNIFMTKWFVGGRINKRARF